MNLYTWKYLYANRIRILRQTFVVRVSRNHISHKCAVFDVYSVCCQQEICWKICILCFIVHIFNEYPASLTVCLCLDVSCLICLPLIWWQANMEWYSLWKLGSGVAFKRPHILSAHNRQTRPGQHTFKRSLLLWAQQHSGLGMRIERCDVWGLKRSVSGRWRNILKCLKAGKKMVLKKTSLKSAIDHTRENPTTYKTWTCVWMF